MPAFAEPAAGAPPQPPGPERAASSDSPARSGRAVMNRYPAARRSALSVRHVQPSSASTRRCTAWNRKPPAVGTAAPRKIPLNSMTNDCSTLTAYECIVGTMPVTLCEPGTQRDVRQSSSIVPGRARRPTCSAQSARSDAMSHTYWLTPHPQPTEKPRLEIAKFGSRPHRGKSGRLRMHAPKAWQSPRRPACPHRGEVISKTALTETIHLRHAYSRVNPSIWRPWH